MSGSIGPKQFEVEVGRAVCHALPIRSGGWGAAGVVGSADRTIVGIYVAGHALGVKVHQHICTPAL